MSSLPRATSPVGSEGRNGPTTEVIAPSVDRVLFVAGELADDSTGHSVLRLARELRRLGKDVDLVCGGGALCPEFERIGVTPYVVPLLLAPRRALVLPRALVSHVRAFEPDLLHVFGRSLAGWAVRLSHAVGCPYVLAVMTYGVVAREGTIRGDWRRGSVLAMSEEIREALVNQARVPKAAIGVVPVGIALEDYERYRDAGGSASVPVVGMVGPLELDRGGEYFLRAAKEILERGYEAHFLIAGAGSQWRSLRRLVRNLRITRWVTMVPGFSDYRRMLAVLDVCLFPALCEGLGLGVLEAMACRKPVVATSVGPVCSVVSDGETGYLAPRKDFVAMAEKVIELLDHPEAARRIVDSAYEMVRERFSMEASVRKLLQFYSRCLARAGGS